MSTLQIRATFHCPITAGEPCVAGHPFIAAMAAAILLCFFNLGSARADLIEYYNYTIDEEGDTTVVIVASFDTTAMQLRGEIQQSPLGTAASTSALIDQGGGHLTGHVAVSVTDGGGQYLILKSSFEFLPSYGPSHSDTVDVDFDVPATQTEAGAGSVLRQQYIEVDFEIKTTYDAQNDKKETSAAMIATAQVGDQTKLTLTDRTTVTDEGGSTEKSLFISIKPLNGQASINLGATQSEDEDGEQTGSVYGWFNFSDAYAEAAARLVVEKDDEVIKQVYGIVLRWVANEKTWVEAAMDYEFDTAGHSNAYLTATIGRQLTSSLQGLLTLTHNFVENNTNLFLGLCLFGPLPPPNGDVAIARTGSLAETLICGSSQSTYCWPDKSSCSDQPLIEDQTPRGDWEKFGMDYQCGFDASAPNSLTESMDVYYIAGVPTVSPWGLIFIASSLLIAGAMILILRRRRIRL